MVDITIPGWALAILVPIILWMFGWMWVLQKEVNKNKEAIALNNLKSDNVSNELNKISGQVDKMYSQLKEHIDRSMERFEHRLDTFIGQELDLLKTLVGQKK